MTKCVRENGDCRKKCTVCAKLPFRGRTTACTILAENDVLWDFDAGLYELVHRFNQLEEEEGLEPSIAQATARSVLHHCKRARTELRKAGLMHTKDQNYTGDNNEARMMAPFDLDEIEVGHLLGTGGFSSAFDIISFKKNPSLSSQVHPCEEAARTFLAEHALSQVEPSTRTTPRYAIKHLRQALTKEPDKFERAAIDLALETQLLLIMDHPNMSVSFHVQSYSPRALLCSLPFPSSLIVFVYEDGHARGSALIGLGSTLTTSSFWTNFQRRWKIGYGTGGVN